MCPNWFNMIQGTSFEIDEESSDIKNKKLLFVSGCGSKKIEIKKLAENLWQINCFKNGNTIHEIELSEEEFITALLYPKKFIQTAVKNKFIHDNHFVNFPLPNEYKYGSKRPEKENFSLYLRDSTTNKIKIMLDLK